MAYTAKDYRTLVGIEGFSPTLLNNHFTLYQGYVTNTNKIQDQLTAMLNNGDSSTPEYAELKRRFGFEFNGMRLHEYYFENLAGKTAINKGGDLVTKLNDSFGSYDAWEQDFQATGAMRGIGWVVLYQDEMTGDLYNTWINEHETGHLAGCRPILVMDVFEHAYMTDYGIKRMDYIAAFFRIINWKAVENRIR